MPASQSSRKTVSSAKPHQYMSRSLKSLEACTGKHTCLPTWQCITLAVHSQSRKLSNFFCSTDASHLLFLLLLSVHTRSTHRDAWGLQHCSTHPCALAARLAVAQHRSCNHALQCATTHTLLCWALSFWLTPVDSIGASGSQHAQHARCLLVLPPVPHAPLAGGAPAQAYA